MAKETIIRKARSFITLTLAALTVLAGTSLRGANASDGNFIADFYAGCTNFNVDVSAAGLTDDGSGMDKVRYQIVDAAGHVLYQEDAARPLNGTAANSVYNVAYQNGAIPTQNPITFKLIDLDKSGNPSTVRRTASYDASCLASSGHATYNGIFEAPESFIVPIAADSALYSAPGGTATALRVRATENWLGVYRTPDNSWVGVFTNGNVLGWLPASVVGGAYTLLPMRATQIERLYVSGIPDGFSMTPGDPSFLHSAPSLDAPVIGNIDAGTIWTVTGQSADGEWIRIAYKGQNAWIYRGLVCLMNGSATTLPIINS